MSPVDRSWNATVTWHVLRTGWAAAGKGGLRVWHSPPRKHVGTASGQADHRVYRPHGDDVAMVVKGRMASLDVPQVSVMVLVTVVVVVSTTPARPDDAVTVRMLPQPKLCLPMYYGVPCWYIPRFPYVVPLH